MKCKLFDRPSVDAAKQRGGADGSKWHLSLAKLCSSYGYDRILLLVDLLEVRIPEAAEACKHAESCSRVEKRGARLPLGSRFIHALQ